MVADLTVRRDVWTFLAVLLAFSSIFYAIAILVPESRPFWGNYALGFMWCPGLAALVTALLRNRTLRGFGWGLGRWRYLFIAYGLAIVLCLAAYLVVWLAFDAFSPAALLDAAGRAGVPPALQTTAGVLTIATIVLPLTSIVSAAGEEIGWRGYLVPRMHALVGFTGTSLIVGLIWAAWHYPINAAVFPLHRPGVPLWYANACFTILVVGASFAHTWLRLQSQSLWPSALFHATGNAIQGVLQAATQETSVTAWLTTEYGASFAIAGVVLVVVFWRARPRG
jgi:membrane protease YdiL (CAAX protease family)